MNEQGGRRRPQMDRMHERAGEVERAHKPRVRTENPIEGEGSHFDEEHDPATNPNKPDWADEEARAVKPETPTDDSTGSETPADESAGSETPADQPDGTL